MNLEPIQQRRYHNLPGGWTGRICRPWTVAERRRIITIANNGGTCKQMAAACPKRTPSAIKSYWRRLLKAGMVKRQRNPFFVRTAELDAEFTQAVVDGLSLVQLSERFGRGIMRIHTWKRDLGIVGPRDQGAASKMVDVQ